jgi:hypothetical protein
LSVGDELSSLQQYCLQEEAGGRGEGEQRRKRRKRRKRKRKRKGGRM